MHQNAAFPRKKIQNFPGSGCLAPMARGHSSLDLLKLVSYSPGSIALRTVSLRVMRDRLEVFFLSSMNAVQCSAIPSSGVAETGLKSVFFLSHIRLRDRVLATIVRSHTKQPINCDTLKQVGYGRRMTDHRAPSLADVCRTTESQHLV